MRLTSSATARRNTRMASARSRGSPHTPGPVICIAPKPIRWTVTSPSSNVPLAAAVRAFATGVALSDVRWGGRIRKSKSALALGQAVEAPAEIHRVDIAEVGTHDLPALLAQFIEVRFDFLSLRPFRSHE